MLSLSHLVVWLLFSATTANTNASDGALTVAGGLGVALDASIGDDLRMISDVDRCFVWCKLRDYFNTRS